VGDMLPARNKLEISGIGDCFGFTDATRIRIIQLMIKNWVLAFLVLCACASSVVA
jgi:hypothetical protein